MMRRACVLAILVLLFLPAITARADPATSVTGPGQRKAEWTFSNPTNYTLDNVTLDATGGFLTWQAGAATDSDTGDFSRAPTLVNIDLSGSPGNVAILNTSQQGAPQTLPDVPTPAALADTYLFHGSGGNDNFGLTTDLNVGYNGSGPWYRALIRFPSFPLPINAVVRYAELELYMHTATPAVMPVSVHRVTTPWTELGATWDRSDGVNSWGSAGGGGDFDPIVVDTIPISGTIGWYGWNVTSLVAGWWTNSLSNNGLLVRQQDDELRTVLGLKQFSSSDEGNANLRPRLLITYTTPGSSALLESRVLDAGGASVWGALWWNTTRPPGTSVAVQTRSGNASVVDVTWSPWSAPYPAIGSPITSPAARYLEYRLSLFTPTNSTPIVHDVSATWIHHAASGLVVTERLLPENLTGWSRVDVDSTAPAGTGVVIAYSQDNGTSWALAVPGQNIGAFPSAIALRLTLTTNDTTVSPRVRSFSVGFLVPGPPGLPTDLLLWVSVLVAVVLSAWTIARRVLREPFVPTDLFLIHEDGRLVTRVGGPENPIEDDIAVSGMFTLVAQFVKDSFGAPGGGGGELRNFQVDEREVSIAKGDYLFLALVARGPPPPILESSMKEFLAAIESAHGPMLRDWDGLAANTGELEGNLRWYLDAGHHMAHPKLPRGDITSLDTGRESLMTRAHRFVANALRRAPGRLGPYRKNLSRWRHGRG